MKKNYCIRAAVFLLLCTLHSREIFSQQKRPVSLYAAASFPIGASVNPNLLRSNADYRRVLSEQFNSITTENALKWSDVHPQKDIFDFSGGDTIAAFCIRTHKRLHGHNLVWYIYNPTWLNHFQGDTAAWDSVLRNHIHTVMGHYKGIAASWDVVNEAFDDSGRLRIFNCIWAQHLGAAYLEKAFIYAREADPSALLFYNDYGQEYSPAKMEAIVAMVQDFKKRGIPIDGLGIQMHININTSREGISRAIETLASTGLKIHISELDIAINVDKEYNRDRASLQASLFGYVVQQYRRLVPAGQQWGITTWNVGDRDSWLRRRSGQERPLLFDDAYQPKAAYYAFLKALSE